MMFLDPTTPPLRGTPPLPRRGVAFLQLTQSLNGRGFQFELEVRQQPLAPVAKELPPLCGWDAEAGNVRLHKLRFHPGSTIVNVEPVPSLLATVMVPPWLSIACFAMASPRPVPPESRVRDFSTR